MGPSSHIRVKVIIEVVGKPKEHVEESIRAYIKKIKGNSDFVILKSEIADTEPQGNLFSTYAELEIVLNGTAQLIGFCFDYMPSSIDIIKPESFTISNRDLNAMLNDLQAKLHTVDMVAKTRTAELEFLKRNFKTALQNLILISLVKREFSLEELSDILKINMEELKAIVLEMEKNNKIKKEGERYRLAHGQQKEG